MKIQDYLKTIGFTHFKNGLWTSEKSVVKVKDNQIVAVNGVTDFIGFKQDIHGFKCKNPNHRFHCSQVLKQFR